MEESHRLGSSSLLPGIEAVVEVGDKSDNYASSDLVSDLVWLLLALFSLLSLVANDRRSAVDDMAAKENRVWLIVDKRKRLDRVVKAVVGGTTYRLSLFCRSDSGVDSMLGSIRSGFAPENLGWIAVPMAGVPALTS